MENTNTVNLIKDSAKLKTKIRAVAGAIDRNLDSIQPLLASAIWRGYAHSDNSGADLICRLVKDDKLQLQSKVKRFLLAFGPFVEKDGMIGVKQGTKDDIAKADSAVADLPNWRTFAKAPPVEKPYDAGKAITSLVSGLKKKLEEGKIAKGDKPAVLAFLSYHSNITAGITREALLADMLIAHDEKKAKESIAA